MPVSYSAARFAECAQQIADQARELAAQGWIPATSGNFSLRLDDQHVAVTASGCNKAELTPQDVIVVDLAGQPLHRDGPRPSAETLLHTQIYRRFESAGAILHTHSLAQTLASRVFASQQRLVIEGYELLKAFAGYSTHLERIVIPVFANSQDMDELAQAIDDYLAAERIHHVYLIDGHGAYAWGATMADARRHLDALEFLLRCELDMRRLNA
ncbi:MAG: methylthioribulose 1-phosphate dehydratase [Xanthomonadales bacterium]|nr:methylthioribulose 1-phosphate dehydratase [Xanthomonadales bacterium]